MNRDPYGKVTDILEDWNLGDPSAIDRLMPVVYSALRRIASRMFAAESPGHTLTPTAVVHEAYIRLSRQHRSSWRNRAQFFAIASRMMRRILVDHARRKRAKKREWCAPQPSTLYNFEGELIDVIALERALTRLESLAPRQVRVVELRFFGGLTVAETADLLGVSPRTVRLDWASARAWLYRRVLSDRPV